MKTQKHEIIINKDTITHVFHKTERHEVIEIRDIQPPVIYPILYDYLEKEWKLRNNKKYHCLFKEWIKNLTEQQIDLFTKEMLGRK
jgi:hypothetical protein